MNDVVLDLCASGLRALLMSRGEAVTGVELAASQAVSTRKARGDAGNQRGAAVVGLAAGESDIQW